jgi:KTSC domain
VLPYIGLAILAEEAELLPKHQEFGGSEAISSATYNPLTGTVEITFNHGGTYSFDCTEAEWEAFIHSGSPGRFFNEHFK